MRFFRVFEHVLPTGRAWRITVDKTLRRFVEALAAVMDDAREYLDRTWSDIDPQQTRKLRAWEDQFALSRGQLNEQQRRDRLAATWKQLGGQDPDYIQASLRAAGFDVYVHEWWEPVAGRPAGGSVDGDVTPVARDPRVFLVGDTVYQANDGGVDAQDGDPEMQDGGVLGPRGYPLVNKVLVTGDSTIGDGNVQMQDGDPAAQDGGAQSTFQRKEYTVPDDPDTWPHFIYIGGETFPDRAQIPPSRRDEFEDLCLKICPVEKWLGVLVVYA